MLTATQSFRKTTDAGQPLPTVWESFRKNKIIKRRGQVHMTAGAPGGFKSVLTLAEAIHARVPTLYVSLDGDPMTVGSRLIQMAAVCGQEEAEEAFLTRSPLAMRVASLVPWLTFTYPASATTDDIAHHVWAYAEAHGDWPHRVVIDNLSDVTDEDDAAGLNRAMDDLTVLARETRAAVDVLHHVGGDYENGDMPIPLSGLRYKVGKKPALVTTLHSGAADNQLWVSVVKNRFGPHDAKGLRVRAELRVDPTVMQVTDPFVIAS